jgi:hypothetical protein
LAPNEILRINECCDFFVGAHEYMKKPPLIGIEEKQLQEIIEKCLFACMPSQGSIFRTLLAHIANQTGSNSK